MTLEDAITGILQREGSTFTRDVQDQPTKYGVTLTTYRAYRPGATEQDIKVLTEDQARGFYRQYLGAFAGLPVGPRVWDNILDAVTLHGPHGTVQAIQHAVDVPVDGVLGPTTRTALKEMDPDAFVAAFVKARFHVCTTDIFRELLRKYGQSILVDTDLKYLEGWHNRVVDVAFGVRGKGDSR